MNRKTFWIIFLLGVAMRVAMIWIPPLWYDENFSLILARLPLLRLLEATAADVHPPLFYLLIWPIGQLTHTAWLVRLPSLFLSIGTLALFPRLLNQFSVGPRAQAIAFAMLAILPMQLQYAQEARMYALLEFLFVVGAISVLEDRKALLVLSVAGMLYTQNYGLFYTATLLLLSLIDYGITPKGRGQQSAIVLGIILWLPWIPVLQGQMNTIKGIYWLFDASFGTILHEIWKTFFAFTVNHPAGMVASMLIVFPLLMFAIWHLFWKRPPFWYEIATLAFGPLAFAIIASSVQPVVLFRPLIGITPFMYLACALFLAEIKTLRMQLYAACFIVPILVMSISGYYAFIREQKEYGGTGDLVASTKYILDRWQPGDVIYHANDASLVNFMPYVGDRPQYLMPDCEQKAFGTLSDGTRLAIGIDIEPIEKIQYKRIWFIGVESPLLPACAFKQYEAITKDLGQAAYVMHSDKLVYSAIWLLTK